MKKQVKTETASGITTMTNIHGAVQVDTSTFVLVYSYDTTTDVLYAVLFPSGIASATENLIEAPVADNVILL